MVIEKINVKIKEMKELRKLEYAIANRKHQEKIDSKFHKIAENTHQLVMILNLVNHNKNIELNCKILEQTMSMLEDLKSASSDGLVSEERLFDLESKFKELQVDVKKEWNIQYNKVTCNKISTLRVISRIEPNKVNKVLGIFEESKIWSSNIDTFKAFFTALDNADELISNMGLNQEIVDFLKKMNIGKASLVDLNPNVLEWIKKENLMSSIKISFTNKGI